jgi:hypothetical protein
MFRCPEPLEDGKGSPRFELYEYIAPGRATLVPGVWAGSGDKEEESLESDPWELVKPDVVPK